jgi:diguanylate cyclase (GGDEF)-like protein
MAYRHSIQHRLVISVSLGLLIFSGLAGGLIYRWTYSEALTAAARLERQLVSTVQTQAEVAVYAVNSVIAEGVIEGLRANPHVLAVRLIGEAETPLNVSGGIHNASTTATLSEYPLFAPMDSKQLIGQLIIHRNDALIDTEATLAALRQTLIMLLQMIATALLIVLFSRHQIGKPVARLADELAAIKPGSGTRISITPEHANDEIGSLASSANALIQAAEDALTEVQALATTDSLTGLPNRRAFIARIEDEHARIKRYELPPASVLMLDLDYFKQVNDNHGHAAGDVLLRRFGALLADELRKVDTAGRFGGEEFAILLPGTEISAALIFAERFRKLVAETAIPHGESILHMTVSIGITALNSNDNRPDDALARADTALYQAKAEGRNRVLVHGAAKND